MKIITLVKELYPFFYSIVSDGNDESIKKYKKYLNFRIHKFESGKELNGWKIPPNWTVSKAEIRYNNKLIYNGLSSPLGVPVLSNSFKGKIKWNTLKNNLFYDNKIKNAVVYNWKALYRQNNDWGFCIPKIFMIR